MCDPMTLVALGSAAFGMFSELGKPAPAAPPTPQIVTPQSAVSAPLGRNAGATVRIGTADKPEDTKPVLETQGTKKFATKRQTAKLTVGNLGRGGLEL